MKKKYIIPQTDEQEMILQFMLAQSTSAGGTGTNFDDPLTVTDDDFNSMF